MKPYHTYTEFFYEFKGKIEYWEILKNVPSIRRRRKAWVAIILLIYFTLSIISFSHYYYTGSLLKLVPLLILFILFVFTVFFLLKKLEKPDLRDLLNGYKKDFEFSEKEKTNISKLVDRIRNEMLKAYLGESINNADYIKNLKENCKESSEVSKRDFKLKELGVVAIALIILNNYFSALYNLWRPDSEKEISLYTALIFFLIGAVCLSYYFIKDVYLTTINSSHRCHKQLYYLLRDIETKAKFN